MVSLPDCFLYGLSIAVRVMINMKKSRCISIGEQQIDRFPGIDYAAYGGMGISHGLKTVHRTVFLTAFRFPYGV